MDTFLARVFIFTLVLGLQTAQATWWYLGLASSAYQTTLQSPSINFKSKCSKIAVFEPPQRELCLRAKNVLDIISQGASMGIEECKHQFLDRRWNCTTFNNTSVFGNVLNINSREKAYIYSISAAGVMHAVTKACSKGQLNICTCDQKVSTREPQATHIWGGCSDNVHFGYKFTREFVDSKENRKAEEGLMNLWNNNAGRKIIKHDMQLLCKCHGVSGSCSVRICWRTMPTFREIGSNLRRKFDAAGRVRMNKRGTKLKPMSPRQKKPTKEDLVYLDDSPDFCETNADLGSLGTRGRACNATSNGLDGCTLMCCGRGYSTILKQIKEDCNCKFHWCCRVDCDKCTTIIEQAYCN